MFDTEILNALNSGKTIDEIAKEISTALTAAAKAKEEETSKREENLNKLADAFGDAFFAYVEAAAPDMVLDDKPASTKELRELLDNIIELLKLADELDFKPTKRVIKIPKEATMTFDTDDKAISDFLKGIGLV